MVESVRFPEQGEGYIYEKVEMPEKPTNNRSGRYCKKGEDYKKAMKEYKAEMAYYKKHKDEYILPCSNLLVGKEFKFMDNKINILFGKNGTGKSTILRAIAGNAMCEDGFSWVFEPLQMGGFWEKEFDADKKALSLMKNTAEVRWSGNPIYFDNFSETLRKNTGGFGDLQGSILSCLEDEALFLTEIQGKVSGGEMAKYIYNKICTYLRDEKSMEDIVLPRIKQMSEGNETWKACATEQLNRFKRLPDYNKKSPVTLLFDEVDKSMDIESVIKLYTVVLPKLVHEYKCQIITVSHNPIVLSNAIYGNTDDYNILSMEQDYTNNIIELLRKIF